jgi:hypothetical protein
MLPCHSVDFSEQIYILLQFLCSNFKVRGILHVKQLNSSSISLALHMMGHMSLKIFVMHFLESYLRYM